MKYLDDKQQTPDLCTAVVKRGYFSIGYMNFLCRSVPEKQILVYSTEMATFFDSLGTEYLLLHINASNLHLQWSKI